MGPDTRRPDSSPGATLSSAVSKKHLSPYLATPLFQLQSPPDSTNGLMRAQHLAMWGRLSQPQLSLGPGEDRYAPALLQSSIEAIRKAAAQLALAKQQTPSQNDSQCEPLSARGNNLPPALTRQGSGRLALSRQNSAISDYAAQSGFYPIHTTVPTPYRPSSAPASKAALSGSKQFISAGTHQLRGLHQVPDKATPKALAKRAAIPHSLADILHELGCLFDNLAEVATLPLGSTDMNSTVALAARPAAAGLSSIAKGAEQLVHVVSRLQAQQEQLTSSSSRCAALEAENAVLLGALGDLQQAASSSSGRPQSASHYRTGSLPSRPSSARLLTPRAKETIDDAASASQHEVSELRRKLSESETALHALRLSEAAWTAQHGNLSTLLESAQQEVRRLKGELEASRQQAALLEHDCLKVAVLQRRIMCLESCQQQVKGLQSQNQQLLEEMHDLKASHEQLQATNAVLRQHRDQLQQTPVAAHVASMPDSDHSATTIQTLTGRLQSAEQQVRTLQAALDAAMQAQQAQHATQQTQREQCLDEAERELQKMRVHLRNDEERLSEAELRIEAASARVKASEGARYRAEAATKAAFRSAAAAERRADGAQTQLQALQQELDRKEKSLREMRSAMANLVERSADNEEAGTRVAGLQQKLQQAQQAGTAAQQALQHERQAHSGTQHRLAELSSTLLNSQQWAQQLQEQCLGLQQQVQRHEKQFTALKRALSQYQTPWAACKALAALLGSPSFNPNGIDPATVLAWAAEGAQGAALSVKMMSDMHVLHRSLAEVDEMRDLVREDAEAMQAAGVLVDAKALKLEIRGARPSSAPSPGTAFRLQQQVKETQQRLQAAQQALADKHSECQLLSQELQTVQGRLGSNLKQ